MSEILMILKSFDAKNFTKSIALSNLVENERGLNLK